MKDWAVVTREQAPHRIQRRRWDGDTAKYGVWTENPLIFFVSHGIHGDASRTVMNPLFDGIGDRPAWFVVIHWWNKESVESAQLVVDWEQQHNSRYPSQKFIHLCNTPLQFELFTSAGLDSVFCNQNALVDEHIFRPDAQTQPRFDALYDARFAPFKRHNLASEVPSLALMYTQRWFQRWPAYEWKSRRALRHAHDFNREADNRRYQNLTRPDIADRIRACRVGLILSAEEGANYASMQYLLSGLGVVSTESKGGRDVFFDPATTLIVEATPEAVRAGVDEMVSRNLDPDRVMAITLERIVEHRERLLDRLQEIYDTAGVKRSVRSDWETSFNDKMIMTPQSHKLVIASLLETADVHSP